MLDLLNCGHYPEPKILQELDDDRSFGLKCCLTMDRYSCIGCEFYLKKEK